MTTDLARAFRALRKNPGFFAVATLTLAVGLGPTIAVFSVFEALMLRTLPVERPGELAVLGPGSIGTFSRSDMPQAEIFSFSQYEALREDNRGVLASVAATPTFDSRVYWGDGGTAGSELLTASCFLVTGTYFPLLEVHPFRGRLLAVGDDTAPGANPVAVLSHEFWSTSLGADPESVGSTIRLQGVPYTIVGIAEPSFRGHVVEIPVDIWVPMSMQEQITLTPSRLEPFFPVETYWLNILVRLRPGISMERAEAAVNARLQQVFLEQVGDGISDQRRAELERIQVPLEPVDRGLSRLRNSTERPLILLWGTTGLVLLVACANLGSLLLVRASGRQDEFRVRRALGANHIDLMRPVLAETTVLAGTGAVSGFMLAGWLVPLMQGWLLTVRGAGRLDVQLAIPELFFTAAAGMVTLLGAGLIPAAVAAADGARNGLRISHAGVTSGREATRIRSLLVAGQFTVALVLLTTAGLFLRTISELRATDLGIDATPVVGISVDPRGGRFSPETQPSVRRTILDRVEALPGVESAAFTGSLPLRGNVGMSTISVADYAPAENEQMAVIHVWASEGYFETLGIRLVEGRLPYRGEANSVIVNQAFGDRFFAGNSPLGGIVNRTDRIVGVVRNVRQVNVRDDPPPLLYQSTESYEGFLNTLAVRFSGPVDATVAAVRRAVEEAAPGMPMDREYASVQIHLERGIALERMLARLVGAFATVTLVLCAIGLFGVCSQMARNRTGEFGLRMALGATRAQVQALVVNRALKLLLVGAAAGTVGAAISGQLVSGLLYQVGPFDWTVLAWAMGALTVCACLAASAPALRAGSISPSSALRHD